MGVDDFEESYTAVADAEVKALTSPEKEEEIKEDAVEEADLYEDMGGSEDVDDDEAAVDELYGSLNVIPAPGVEEETPAITKKVPVKEEFPLIEEPVVIIDYKEASKSASEESEE